jgi:hypothetical protein
MSDTPAPLGAQDAERAFVRGMWPLLDHKARWDAVQAGRRLSSNDPLRRVLLELLGVNVVRCCDGLVFADRGHRAREPRRRR